MIFMSQGKLLDREEYIEQAYFFRNLRERLALNLPAQEILERIDQEILATTRLPLAVQFLATEIKHTGVLSSGFRRLGHYFTPFQTFIIASAEAEQLRFTMTTGLVALQREAEFRASGITPAGLVVYQFEILCRNRLGYDAGLTAMAGDPYYDKDWKNFLDSLAEQVGLVDFADILFLRSEYYAVLQRRQVPTWEPNRPLLFGEKEGRIAWANRGRDPLFLFAALQRQLGYPEVPRPKARDETGQKIEMLQAKVRDLESRLKLLEGEVRGNLDLNQFGKPELFKEVKEWGDEPV